MGNHAAAEAKGIVIDVSFKKKSFPPWRWKEALLYYLNKIWSGTNLSGESTIFFPAPGGSGGEGITLRLCSFHGQYSAHRTLSIEEGTEGGPWGLTILAGPEQAEVEQGLIRFVRNEEVDVLEISFGNYGALALEKAKRSVGLCFYPKRLPTRENFRGCPGR